jgi:hypothetical protein
MALTTRNLDKIKPGEWLSDDGRRGAGRLLAFGMKNGGAAFYFRYTNPRGARDSLPLGHYDPRGRDGLTLPRAQDRAGELSQRYQAGERDLRAILDAEQREAERQRKAAEAAQAAHAASQRATLGALLDAYVAQLKRDGKASARAVERSFNRHVRKAWPDLWGTPAKQLRQDDLLAILAKMVDAGTLREAAKLRSYLRAAYAAAIRARQDARGLQSLRDLRIETNLARDLTTIEGSSKERDRALSVAELRAYWRRIDAMRDAEGNATPDGAMLAFHLLTGGQRFEQLSRATVTDVDEDAQALLLLDAKGRRRRPRVHTVPLIPAAREALEAMRGGELGRYVFTVSHGHAPVGYHVIQNRVRALATAMVEAGEAGAVFTPGDLRRTVETRLAAAGVSMEVRGQLQSHGLGGVQARHYDRHDYLAEKRAALETLYRIVTGADAAVLAIKRAAR